MTGADESVQHEDRADENTSNGFPEFAQHYNASSATVHGILLEVLESLASFKPLHNWDERLIVSPLKQLKAACAKYVYASDGRLDFLLGYAVVDEVCVQHGEILLSPAMAHPGDVDRHLFFRGNAPQITNRDAQAREAKADKAESFNTGGAKDRESEALRGRIIYIDERTPDIYRPALLLLFAFCIRLHNEDEGYIEQFITRHLSVKNLIRMPQHIQETTGPSTGNHPQSPYKRVSISCHIVYMSKTTSSREEIDGELSDRNKIFPAHHSEGSQNPTGLRLFRATTSTLLTIAIPETCDSREEYAYLLQKPEGFWVVFAVNGSARFAADEGLPEHLTPVAQYIRGITSSLVIQRQHAESILETLREKAGACDGDSLFDDEAFTRSNLYHWTVRTCDELRNTISATLRFIQRIESVQLERLTHQAHLSESPGVSLWLDQLHDEIFKLEDIREQTSALNAQVQESRNALHGVTAVLEARVALRQGERTKVLGYLAAIYLPLTATASIYSMSVLPSSATLYSFFVVLIGLIIATLATGYFIAPGGIGSNPNFRPPTLQALLKSTVRPYSVVTDFCAQLKAPKTWPDALKRIPLLVLVQLPDVLFRKLLMPEIMLPKNQWVLSQYLENPFLDAQWRPVWFVRDVFRYILLPVWACLAVFIVLYISTIGVGIVGIYWAMT